MHAIKVVHPPTEFNRSLLSFLAEVNSNNFANKKENYLGLKGIQV